METIKTPEYRTHYNVNERIKATNYVDVNNNPTGGSVMLFNEPAYSESDELLKIQWQDGPRGTGEEDRFGNPILKEPNGAFVEDVIWAALQRLEFFNEGKYRDRANSLAITHLEQALQALKDRQLERSFRKVEGKHEV